MPVLLYAGDQDLMCAGIGIEAAIAQLSWNGEKGFVRQPSALLPGRLVSLPSLTR